MSGKRKWSATRAVADMHRAYSGWDPTDPSVPIDTAHLARAYLAGIKAAVDVTKPGAPRWPAAALLRSEQARLNKRASKRGKDRT